LALKNFSSYGFKASLFREARRFLRGQKRDLSQTEEVLSELIRAELIQISFRVDSFRDRKESL